MNEVKRKPGESFDGLLRRFQRRTQLSGLQKEVRHRKVREDVPNKNQRRVSKIRGLSISNKMHWMLKTGRATEQDYVKKRKGR